MACHSLAYVLAILGVTSAASNQGRWSRQISSYTSDLSDWVPLPGPGPVGRELPRLPQIKRQAVAEPRILAEPVFPGFQRPTGFSQDFPGRTYFNSAANRQLYLQSVPAVPSAPQNFLNDQGFSQGLRFGLAQPNFPLNQGFVGPQFSFDSPPQKLRPQPQIAQISNPVSFPKSNPVQQIKPFINQAPKKIEAPKYVDGYRVENDPQTQRKPQSLQKLKFDTFESTKVPKTEMVPPKAKSEREEVQLLYVPLESLNKGQFNFRSPLSSGQIVHPNTYTQNQRPGPAIANPTPAKQSFAADFQRPVSHPIDNYSQEFFANLNSFEQGPQVSTITTPFPTSPAITPKPKKLKPHQPPLAIFMTQEAKKGTQVKVGDVLSSLKNAESVAVLDSVNPLTAPKVFIGPSNLNPPDNFVKFELPYLSNIDHSDKKIRQLPFFVAPLSYNTPQGFAKIPFPSPHVGSVVINSQIKDSSSSLPSPTADVIPNSYTSSPQSYVQQQAHERPISHATQKPTVSFYTTSAPKTNAPLAHKSNYYSFEPQTVSTVRTPKEPQASIVTDAPAPKQPGSYFLSSFQDQYPAIPEFDTRNNFKNQGQEPVRAFNIAKQTESTTTRTTISSTTPKPSTYPSQLLETHNPYSINQAFHFSTPLDYHNLFEETYATPDSRFAQPSPPSQPQQEIQLPREPQQSITNPSTTPSSTPKYTEPVTEKTYQQSSPIYLQNYSPEIHYESELANSRYQINNNNEYTSKPELSDLNQPSQQDSLHSVDGINPSVQYNSNSETQSEPVVNTEAVNNAQAEQETSTSTKSPYLYNQYDTSYESEKQSSPTTTPSTTTTRKSPIRNRGRPRYTTPKADSNESTARTVVTRKPLRERRPLPSRTRYEPNKITTERATRKPVDSNESTTKYSRGRTRGRVQYKPTESDEHYGKQKQGNSKEQDLAYQRDVLHQNYPVTLMERSSTVDIEAITEPVLPKISSTKLSETVTEVYDTENAYSYDRASVSQHIPSTVTKEESYTTRAETQTQTETYASRQPSSHEDYAYQSRSSIAPVEAYSQYDESIERQEEDARQTTPPLKSEVTEPTVAVTEQSPSSYSIGDLSSKPQFEEVTTTPEFEITRVSSHETTPEEETEASVVQTTPSYNRVRVRPGVIRQYHQASSAESTRNKTRRPSQPVTYRPAFDRRRTTMRIEEIEADLKTKQVHARAEQEHRHPVYRPDATTEASATTSSKQQETTTVRGVFRRRRPSYTTTSTEASQAASTKRTYEVKNRFRGRRPTTEKVTTEKTEIQTEPSKTTPRTYSRYSRPRLSERYNKKPEPEETDDQDSNYSINRPKYVEPEGEQWSPKISTDSFKPYNPNEISDDKKTTTSRTGDELDIITAKNNDYDDILLTVTPASNNRNTKKIPDIPPTLEALVEQSKTTKSDTSETMSTFETMLEEVMKNLEEQDENEYTTNVQKHKGGEIGEIPPERIITSGDNYKTTTVDDPEAITVEPTAVDSTHKEDEKDHKRRRGFWKKVKVRPITTESIEAAESQYYPNTVNSLGHTVTFNKAMHEKAGSSDKSRVTTYKPPYDFLKNIFSAVDDDILPTVDIPKINKAVKNESKNGKESTTEASLAKETPTETSVNPGMMDLGTGAPNPTLDNLYSTQTEPSATTVDKSNGYSFMEYLFGITSEDDIKETNKKQYQEIRETTQKFDDFKITTEQSKPGVPTTETTYIPEEITDVPEDYKVKKNINTKYDFEYDYDDSSKKIKPEEEEIKISDKSVKVETTSASSFTDYSHEDYKLDKAFPHFELKKVKKDISKKYDHNNDYDSSKKVKSEEDVDETTDKSVKVETSSVSSFMDANNVVSTSMSTEISHETEICFRGKCIKTSKDIL